MKLNWQAIPTLHGSRVFLRPFKDGDRYSLYSIYSDLEVMRYWGGGAFTKLGDAQDFLAEVKKDLQQHRCVQWAIVRQIDDVLIGTFALFHWDTVAQKCEIGFALGRDCWGRGYMREALQVALAFAFDHMEMRRVEADVDPRNLAALNLIESLGFRREGLLRERWLIDAEPQDTVFCGLLKKEWSNADSNYSIDLGSVTPTASTSTNVWHRAKLLGASLRVFASGLLHF